ncbi:MAG: hypothetical protein IM537_09725 [Pseudanabaena sp. M57BS1SP1A06MG]|nr:hypothetical protein [Pseudanabaena sp. M53BS1SP1A06MG]MCA6580835.1 hypothetical protein [Pseudanabaena sp. M34BS1SP1A06MG]MCA6592573.1 hypothetical protein [Pseudanabaena sp. M38BS1SP1A06MG]MCA6600467.1 hypothetical protein [Pseudanabaena sp. M57BS1SP1A06MG]
MNFNISQGFQQLSQGLQQFSQAATPYLDFNHNGRLDWGDFKIASHYLHPAIHNMEHNRQAREHSSHYNNHSSHYKQSQQSSEDRTIYCHPDGRCARGRYP